MTDSAWVQTFSGGLFHFLNPKPDEVREIDISHALGNLCRYGGHVQRFYSVAEHCWIMSHIVTPENALYALLHDATEAYVVDLPRPIKRALPDYQSIEHRVWLAIAEYFNLSPEMPAEVLDVDTRMLLNEREVLMAKSPAPWMVDHLEPLTIPSDLTPYGYAPMVASGLYASRLATLTGGRSCQGV